MPRFDGVPPNMSVAISTPPGCLTRSMAAAISSRASCTSSCQPIDTAEKLRQVADDGLGGVDQLGGQLPVGDDDDANHRVPHQVAMRARASDTPLRSGSSRFSASAT